MKRLILSATNKGGVGKSFVTIQTVQWLKEHPSKPSFKAFDPDHANRTLLGVHPDVSEFIDVEEPQSIDKVCMALSKVDVSLADGLGSQQRKTFQKWVKEVDLIQLSKDMGFRLTYLLVMEEDATVLEQTKQIVDEMSSNVDWIICRNFKQSQATPLWDNSKTRQTCLNDLGGIEVDFERLYPALAAMLTVKKLSVGGVMTCKEAQGISPLDFNRFKTAWARMKAEIDKAAAYILPNAAKLETGKDKKVKVVD